MDMNNKILTITVPAYNVEAYIQECLDSFIIEEIISDIEVIVVDDGSKDRTAQIVSHYVEMYPDTFKLHSKENGGHGSTINAGIHLAQGKYFKVVDGDDWVNREDFILFIKFLKESDSDLVLTNYYWIEHTTKKVRKKLSSAWNTTQYEKEYEFKEISKELFLRIHAITVKTSIYRKNKIKIDEKKYYVDQEYVLFITPFIDTVTLVNLDVYMYRLGLDGQSMNIKSLQKNVDQHYSVLQSLLRFYSELEKRKIETYRLDFLAKGIAAMVGSQIKIYLSFPMGQEHKKEIIELEFLLKKEYLAIYLSVRQPAVRLLRFTNYSLYPLGALGVRARGF
jgi:glycosyltransferase involved in cell wall biosynthesis